GSALRQWVCRQRGIRDNDSGALLQVLGHDLPGAVELHGDVGEAIDGPPEDLPPDTIRFSLAGVQLKLSMLLLQDRFTLAARGETGRWIVKVPGERFPELPAIEAATMAWARAAGYPVPKFRKLPIESIEGL